MLMYELITNLMKVILDFMKYGNYQELRIVLFVFLDCS